MAQTPVKNPLRGVGSEFGREGFEVGAGDGGAVEMREFFGVGDRFNLFTQALRNSLKADFQRLEDGRVHFDDLAHKAQIHLALQFSGFQY